MVRALRQKPDKRTVSEKKNILVVEDELMIGLHIKVDLEAAGFRVIGPVSSVEGGLSAIRDEDIDAAVLDLKLYNEWSLSIAQALADQNIPFLFLTGSRIGAMANRFKGVTILCKPIMTRTLHKHVQKMVASQIQPEVQRRSA